MLPNVGDLESLDISDGVKKIEGGAQKPNGSSVKHTYKHRTICYYPVTDDELDQIATFNRISTTLFAAGSFLLGLTADLIKDVLTSSDMATALKQQLTGAYIAGAIVCLICYGLGVYFLIVQSRQTTKIKQEAVDDI